MNERPLLAEQDLLEPWCKKVPLKAVALNVSFASRCWLSPQPASPDPCWISAGRYQNLQALTLRQPSKEQRLFRRNKLHRVDG